VTLLLLLLSFLKIGLFSFGGGYAMIPLIQSEIERNGWMTATEFVNIIAIAEMTPGPIAVNSATFIGFKAAGVLGALVATLGVTLPSAVLVLAVASFILRNKENPVQRSVFSLLRPVVAALVLSASFVVARTSLIAASAEHLTLRESLAAPLRVLDPKGFVVLGVSLLLLLRFKLHPALIVVVSGVLGALLYAL
jgi:chromate transporter